MNLSFFHTEMFKISVGLSDSNALLLVFVCAINLFAVGACFSAELHFPDQLRCMFGHYVLAVTCYGFDGTFN